MRQTRYTRKVRFSDTDPQGFVFNANYFTYVDDAVTDLFEAAGLPFSVLPTRGFDAVVVHAECDFKSPGRVGDVLVTEVTVENFGNTSMTLAFETRDESDGRLVTIGKEVYVFTDASHQPVAVPAFVKEAFA